MERRGGESPPPPPDTLLLTDLRLQWQIFRIASNLEVVSVTADIGQQQWLSVFFQFFNRMPISRDRDCYGLVEINEISGGRQVFGLHQRFDHFEHGGMGQAAGTVREEGPPIKAGHWKTIPHLETTCTRFNTSTRRRTCSSAGPGRSLQLQILPSLNSKAVLQPYFSCGTNNSPGTEFLPSAKFLPGTKFLPSAKFLPGAKFLASAKFLPGAKFLPSA